MIANCKPSNAPEESTTPEPEVDSTLPPNASELQLLRVDLIHTQDEVYTLKAKREEILMKWTKTEMERDKLRLNQTSLMKQIDEYENLLRTLNATLKSTDKMGATYIIEAYRLRREIIGMTRNLDNAANDYRSRIDRLNKTLITVEKEKNDYKAESYQRLHKFVEYQDKYEDLLEVKESRDLMMILAICALFGLLALIIVPKVYERFGKKKKNEFNSFENSMQVKMAEVQEGN